MRFVVTGLAVLLGAYLFDRLNVPAGALLGGVVGAVAVNLAVAEPVALPDPVRFVAFPGAACSPSCSPGSARSMR